MKSLNRTLSLVLVLVMVLGLFGIAGAAFTDQAEVQYDEAVGVMTGIGAINGYPDGSFAPAGAITREEAAKIVTYAILGKSIADKLTVSETGFSDVDAGRWSAPHIAYLVSQGIINGMGDGTFAPEANVTGYQLAKMMLCAIGYGANDEFVGTGWELAVAVAANKAGIFTDAVGVDFTAPATREEAALYTFNGLTNAKAVQVTWNKFTERYEYFGDIGGKPATIAREAYGLDLDENVTVTAVTADIDPTSKTFGQLIATAGAYNYVVDSYDVVGTVVDIYFRDNAGKSVYAAIEKTTSVSVYGKTGTQLKAMFPATSYNLVSSATKYDNYAVNGTYDATGVTTPGIIPLTDASTFIFLYNKSTNQNDLVAVHTDVYYMEKVIVGKNADGTFYATVTGTEFDGSGEVLYGLSKKFYDGKINTTTGKPTIDKDATNIDWSAYYNVNPAKSIAIMNVRAIDGNLYFAPAAAVSGAITKIAGDTLTVSGVAYNKTAADLSIYNQAALGIATGFTGEYTLYLDVYGNYFASVAGTTVAEQSAAVYVAASYSVKITDVYGTKTTTTYAQTVATDGTVDKVIIGVDADGTYDKTKGVNTLAAGLYTFATDTESGSLSAKLGFKKAIAVGDTATISALNPVGADSVKASTAFTQKDIVLAEDKVTGDVRVYLNANTKYVFVDGDKAAIAVEVVQGGINATTTAVVSPMLITKDADGNLVADTIYIAGKYTNAGVSASDLLYIPAADSTATVPYMDASGNPQVGYVYTVFDVVTGEEKEVTATNTSLTVGFYGYKEVNSIYTIGTEVDTGKYMAQNYTSKIGELITTTNLTDVNAASAKIVDLRTDAQKTASGVSTISTLNDMAYYTAQGKTITMNIYAPITASGQSVAIIFITGPTAP